MNGHLPWPAARNWGHSPCSPFLVGLGHSFAMMGFVLSSTSRTRIWGPLNSINSCKLVDTSRSDGPCSRSWRSIRESSTSLPSRLKTLAGFLDVGATVPYCTSFGTSNMVFMMRSNLLRCHIFTPRSWALERTSTVLVVGLCCSVSRKAVGLALRTCASKSNLALECAAVLEASLVRSSKDGLMVRDWVGAVDSVVGGTSADALPSACVGTDRLVTRWVTALEKNFSSRCCFALAIY